jgi:hypothetical protein
VYYKLNGSEYKIFSYSSERASDGTTAEQKRAVKCGFMCETKKK